MGSSELVGEAVSSSADRVGRLDQLGVIRGWKARHLPDLSPCFLWLGYYALRFFGFLVFDFVELFVCFIVLLAVTEVSHGLEVEKGMPVCFCLFLIFRKWRRK